MHKKYKIILLFSWFFFESTAHTIFAQEQATQSDDPHYVDIHIGLDNWAIDTSLPEKPEHVHPVITSKLLENESRLPSSNTSWPYREASPWATVHIESDLVRDLKFILKAMANQSFGGRIDELSTDYIMSPEIGFRAGLLDLKNNWCKDYENDKNWIYDPNEYCTDSVNKKMVSSAPGIQIYTNRLLKLYRFQAVAGIYDAKLGGYSDWENGRRSINAPHKTESNYKYGLSFNFLNMRNGNEYNFSWLHSDIKEPRTFDYELGSIAQYNNNFYIAAKRNVHKNVSLNISASYFTNHITDIAYTTFKPTYYYDNQIVFNMTNIDLQVVYSPASPDVFTAGYTQSLRLRKYSSTDLSIADKPVYYAEREVSSFRRHALALAWRHNWSSRISTTFQWLHTVLDISIDSVPPVSAVGNALGAQVAYQF
jgi:hypothetical protein